MSECLYTEKDTSPLIKQIKNSSVPNYLNRPKLKKKLTKSGLIFPKKQTKSCTHLLKRYIKQKYFVSYVQWSYLFYSFLQLLYEETFKCNEIHTSFRSESSKLKLGRNRQDRKTMLKTLRFKDFARFKVE